jgi:hypothetical protein
MATTHLIGRLFIGPLPELHERLVGPRPVFAITDKLRMDAACMAPRNGPQAAVILCCWLKRKPQPQARWRLGVKESAVLRAAPYSG